MFKSTTTIATIPVSLYQGRTGMVSGKHSRVTLFYIGDGNQDNATLFWSLKQEMLQKHHLFLNGVIALDFQQLGDKDPYVVIEALREREHPLLKNKTLFVGLGDGKGSDLLVKTAQKHPKLFQCLLIAPDSVSKTTEKYQLLSFITSASRNVYKVYEKWRRESITVVDKDEPEDQERILTNWSFLNEMRRRYGVKARL
ncbi:hypothetical protein CJU90_5663 [Yarrowia sp. C11]|nr:hypothetical protein CJU90_5663 [Yarrowia sp. C11]KAG5364248.1 hypothetical protein CKK34_3041 [Yarrowia sp. E02]